MTDKELIAHQKIRDKLENARSALKVILSWATFTYKPLGLEAGHALDHEQVQELCRKTLKETAP